MRHVRIHITGIVQGVGMRPFVYREAAAHGIGGWVLNAGDGVHVEAHGKSDAVAAFIRDLHAHAPAASRIDAIAVAELDPGEPEPNARAAKTDHNDDAAENGAPAPAFRIIASEDETAHTTLVSPDIATCDDCLRELFDPADRRYHYPFINCTNCGPRFTIIRDLPYDRAKTSMDAFPMCHACAAEYADPLDRRFHAQPDACFECGPHLTWRERGADEQLVGDTRAASDDIIARCAGLLADGGIVAVKGLGGFHLACRADSEHAVIELRARKRRSNKALAIMVRDLARARELCEVNAAEQELLSGSIRPIVLLRRHTDTPLAPCVAFDLPELGVMLPYTPLQHLLLAACEAHGITALVMTSGNISEEPIEVDDAHAWERLVGGGLADALLGNNRAILSRYDDSVVRVVDGRALPVRRARGYAPQPLALPALAKAASDGRGSDAEPSARSESGALAATSAAMPHAAPALPAASDNAHAPASASAPCILACGAEQKATLALTREQPDGGAACFVSQHIGDLENASTLDAWHDARTRLETLFDLHPAALACDAHPGYFSSQWAREQARVHGLPLVEIQHHHAHIAAVMAEAAARGELDPQASVIGIALDGTGAGATCDSTDNLQFDGTVWGGEVLVASLATFRRAAHLRPWRLPGGATSVRDARRNAYSLLYALGLLEHPGAAQLMGTLNHEERAITATMVERGLNSPLTSSMGRLLDAIAAILGICTRATYEGEPAVLLEAAATRALGCGADVIAGPVAPKVTTAPAPSHSPGQTQGPNPARTATAQDADPLIIDPVPLLQRLLDGMVAGRTPDELALAAHLGCAQLMVDAAIKAARDAQLSTVALSGGVFMNRILLHAVTEHLRSVGLTVLTPHALPVNDGCIAYGQAAIARGRMSH